jgi:hypothetical protein
VITTPKTSHTNDSIMTEWLAQYTSSSFRIRLVHKYALTSDRAFTRQRIWSRPATAATNRSLQSAHRERHARLESSTRLGCRNCCDNCCSNSATTARRQKLRAVLDEKRRRSPSYAGRASNAVRGRGVKDGLSMRCTPSDAGFDISVPSFLMGMTLLAPLCAK